MTQNRYFLFVLLLNLAVLPMECFQIRKLVRDMLRLEPSWTSTIDSVSEYGYEFKRTDDYPHFTEHDATKYAQNKQTTSNEHLDEEFVNEFQQNAFEPFEDQGLPTVFNPGNTGVFTPSIVGLGIASAILIPLGAIASFLGLAKLFSPVIPVYGGAEFAGIGLDKGPLFGNVLYNLLYGRTTTVYANTLVSTNTVYSTITDLQTTIYNLTTTSVSTSVSVSVSVSVTTSVSVSTATTTIIYNSTTPTTITQTSTCCACTTRTNNGQGSGATNGVNDNCNDCGTTPKCGARRRQLKVLDLEDLENEYATRPIIEATPVLHTFWVTRHAHDA